MLENDRNVTHRAKEMDFELRKLRILGLALNFLFIFFIFLHLKDMKQTSELYSLVKFILNHQLSDVSNL